MNQSTARMPLTLMSQRCLWELILSCRRRRDSLACRVTQVDPPPRKEPNTTCSTGLIGRGASTASVREECPGTIADGQPKIVSFRKGEFQQSALTIVSWASAPDMSKKVTQWRRH